MTDLFDLPKSVALPTPAIELASCSKHVTYTMADVRLASGRNRFSVVSTFAGGGGSSIGYRLAGGHVKAASEFVPEAARTYKRNFPDTIVDERDIRELVRDAKVFTQFLASLGLSPGDLDIADGSPPCSEFSNAGRGVADPTIMKSYSDRKQRDISTLPFDYARFVLAARPKVAIMENVPALATRGEDILEGIIRMLSGDYFVAWRVLSASDYGVPQARKRLFAIAIRKDVGEAVGLCGNDLVKSIFPVPTSSPVSISAALANLQQTTEEIRPWETSARTTSLGNAIAKLPKSPGKHTRPVRKAGEKARNFTLTRCSWDLPAPTLTVTGQQPSGLAGAIHPEEDRKFTIPELKRLTGLPDDFILTGTVAQAAERICRMVPPPLTKAIAESVYSRVIKPYRERVK